MFTLYSAEVTGNPGNCSYPHKHVILDEASLKAAITKRRKKNRGELPQYYVEDTHEAIIDMETLLCSVQSSVCEICCLHLMTLKERN